MSFSTPIETLSKCEDCDESMRCVPLLDKSYPKKTDDLAHLQRTGHKANDKHTAIKHPRKI